MVTVKHVIEAYAYAGNCDGGGGRGAPCDLEMWPKYVLSPPAFYTQCVIRVLRC